MVNFKLTVSDAKGKSISKELKDDDATPLLGLQLGDEADAAIVGLAGKIRLTGGSDKSGVPMRSDIHGAARKHVLLSRGVGLQDAEKGQRVRKLMRGNTVSEEIYQMNCRFDGELEGAGEEPAGEGAKDAGAGEKPAGEEPAGEGAKDAGAGEKPAGEEPAGEGAKDAGAKE